MTEAPKTLLDKWGRQMDYLRIAVTDRCNLRCFYCMPAHGIDYLPKKELLTFEEIIRFTQIASELGVTKVRITGGEPFLRKDIIQLLKNIRAIKGIESLNITTNGVLTYEHLDELVDLNINAVNLSLDSLDPANFFKITRRDDFHLVKKCLDGLIERGIKTKINTVVMVGQNTHEINDIALLAKDHSIDVRFIEEMPFNGSEVKSIELWNHTKILNELKSKFGNMTVFKGHPSDPASLYQINGFKGNIGIIPAFSRTFCGTCNRIRLTATGMIKNCLYDEGAVNMKEIMRNGAPNNEIKNILIETALQKEENGLITEQKRSLNKNISESMASIGG